MQGHLLGSPEHGLESSLHGILDCRPDVIQCVSDIIQEEGAPRSKAAAFRDARQSDEQKEHAQNTAGAIKSHCCVLRRELAEVPEP